MSAPLKLPESTRLEHVHLRVHSLEQSLQFYSTVLGLKELRRDGRTVSLAAGDTPLILLSEHADAPPRSRRSPGLFHVAILFPSRKELARVFNRLYEQGYPFQGFSDHGVSEALYLADPEGNGIELYADRPREQWRYENGVLAMMTAPLDLDNLLATLSAEPEEWTGIHPATRIGHVHLQVSDLAAAERFYHEVLGFDVVQRSYPGALFVSAGGYHHHLGLNTWNSRGSAPASPEALGLVSFRIGLPDAITVAEIEQRARTAGYGVERVGDIVRVPDKDGIVVELFVSQITFN